MKTNDPLDHLSIATPCPANWEQMSGDDSVRFCDLCKLHVYNIARLTRKEAGALIANTEGRICARLYRRADGSIITKDCPVGLRAVRRRIAKVAGAVFATIMSLCASVAGQKAADKDKTTCARQVTITRSQKDAGSISGQVVDPIGAVVRGAKIRVAVKGGPAVTMADTDDNGVFRVQGLKSGTYDLSFEAPGFKSVKSLEMKLDNTESLKLSVVLLMDETTAVVGILVGEAPIEASPGKTTFTGDVIRRLPIQPD